MSITTQRSRIVPLYLSYAISRGPPPDRDSECSICCQTIEPETINISHFDNQCHNAWCIECFTKWAISTPVPTCPMCRAPMSRVRYRTGKAIVDMDSGKAMLWRQRASKYHIVDGLGIILQLCLIETARQDQCPNLASLAATIHQHDDLFAAFARYNVDCRWPTSELLERTQNLEFGSNDLFAIWQASRLFGCNHWSDYRFFTNPNTCFLLPDVKLHFLYSYPLGSDTSKRFLSLGGCQATFLPIPVPTGLVRQYLKTSLDRHENNISQMGTDHGYHILQILKEFDHLVYANDIRLWSIALSHDEQSSTPPGIPMLLDQRPITWAFPASDDVIDTIDTALLDEWCQAGKQSGWTLEQDVEMLERHLRGVLQDHPSRDDVGMGLVQQWARALAFSRRRSC